MSVITFILSVIMAMVIGTVADKISPFNMPGSWAGAIVAGFIGAWIGPLLFGTWGPMVAGFSLVPALIGPLLLSLLQASLLSFLINFVSNVSTYTLDMLSVWQKFH